MKLASFNVENLFARVKAMNQSTLAQGRVVLENYSKLNNLLANDTYSAADKNKITALLKDLGLEKADESKFVILRQNRGKLVKRPKSGPMEIIAGGRADWLGWLELKTEAVNEISTRMTAKVLQEVNADVVGVVEAEHRISLKHFNSTLLEPLGADYKHIMLVDGNDERGIDVGVMTREGFPIESMVSHVDRPLNTGKLFCRDCPEYYITTPAGNTLLLMVAHLKSKGYGIPAQSNARRKSEAAEIRKIYDQRRAEGYKFIAIVGDFNDTPDSDPLSPLLQNGSDLSDVFTHPQFTNPNPGKEGTYGTCAASNKIDYILLSPALFSKVQAAGVERRGIWGGANGTQFPHFDEITRAAEAASDHAAIWADLNI